MSLTNISISEDLHQPLRLAIDHYEFESLGAFFRLCSRALIRHHQQGDALGLPLTFVTNGDNTDV